MKPHSREEGKIPKINFIVKQVVQNYYKSKYKGEVMEGERHIGNET